MSYQPHGFTAGFGVVCLAALLHVACGARSTDGLTATVTEQVHPVLIRNEHNVLLQVVVNSKRKFPAHLQSLEFALDGTDDVNDLESLELFHTGGKQEFAADARFGGSAQPSAKLSFRGDQQLLSGANVFWLSCRLKPTADLSHKVGAALTSIGANGGRWTPSGQTAGLRRRIGIALRKHNDDGVHTYRVPSLATGPKGTLFSVYDMRRRMSRDLQEDIDIGLSRSSDGGRTWGPARVIMDMGEYGNLPQEQNGVSDPGIVVDRKTGEIFVFAVWMWGKPGKHQWIDDGSEPGFEIGKSAQFMMVRSRDDGRTWTKPENLTRKLKKREWWLFAPSPQQGINLADGTLVQPAEGRDEKGVLFATLMISRDHGATWRVGTPAFSGGNECQAVQLGDGSIMLNIRNNHERYRAVYVTSDLGKTWRPHETNRNTLIEPNCNASLRRVDFTQGSEAKRILLFANPQSQTSRTHQTIQISFDDGRTWPEKYHLLLDEGVGRGYASISRVDDQHIGIVYEGSQSDVVFEKISLDELLHR
jgi:sialidase-1